tara:strand:+ start:1546 stop:2043 length:498 start_codon:yes stop_codon:yes gene_type:complete
MIKVIESNLEKGVHLLSTISEDHYKNRSVAPYNSSIGIHIRHIMDMFDCIFEGLESGEIDLTARKRNKDAEEILPIGKDYIRTTIAKVSELDTKKLSRIVYVTDDLGEGKIRAEYTLSAILIQAHSHAIHHYASIGYIIHQLGVELPDDTFGFNPTTPKKQMVNS